MRINILFLILLVGFSSFAAAEINEYAPAKLNECVTIKQSCGSCTYVNVSVAYPNSSIASVNKGMSSGGGGLWTYDFCNTSVIGRYDVLGSGDLEGVDTGFDVLYFEVTRLGGKLGDTATTLTWILFIIAIIGNVTYLFLTIAKLATTRETIFGVLTAWAFYVLMIIVYYLSGLMTTTLIGDVSDFFLTILVWSNGVLPMISLVVTMFVKGTKKKKNLSIEEITGNAPFRRWA